jgi:hypothetical protein
VSYEAWGEPDDVDDPLERVEFPRERKPWKRDREAVRLAMQRALNERRAGNPMIERSRGEPYAITKDHAARFQRLNELHYEIFRFRMGLGYGPKRWHRLREFATILERFALVPYFDKAPLP